MKQLTSSKPLLRGVLFPGVVLAVLGLTPVAWGGLQSQTVFCQKNTDGSGLCYGNFVGFREDATSTSSASFREDLMTGTRSFDSWSTPAGGTSPVVYTCIPNAAVSALWEQALSNRGFFRVSWDASGTCDYLRLVNSSQNTNF